jgi:hypothetical protein
MTMLVLGLMSASPASLSACTGFGNRHVEKTRHGQTAEERQDATAGAGPGNRTSQTIESRSFHAAFLRNTSPGQGTFEGQCTVPLSDCSLA